VVDYTERPDEELVAQLSRQDVEAFEALYDRYGNLVYSVSLRILGDVQAAEDVVQEVFLRVWRKPDHYDTNRGRFLTWLLSVARNRAIDEHRSRGRRLRFEVGSAPLDGEGLHSDEADDPALVALLADECAAVRGALTGLPVEQRSAIELAYYGGLTQQEIARALGEPLGTVKTRIRLGMQKMRVALADMKLRREGEDELRGSSGTAGRL
jgi:RNA polymerase sigma-70 factor (ECF subfamily)